MSNNESIKATFKDNLNKLLIEKDVTQKALADFVGVSTATVSDWKKGKKMPLMEKIDKICQFFHVERHELLNTFGGQYDNTFMTFAHQVLTPPAHEIWDYIKNETNIDVKYFAEQTGIDELNFEKLEQGMLVDYGTHKKLVDAYNAIRTMPTLQKDVNHAHYKIPILGTVAAGEPLEAVENIIGYEYLDDRYEGDGYQYFALKIRGDSMTPTIMDGDVVIVRKQSTVDSGQLAIVLVDGENATAKQIDISQSGITVIGHNASVFAPRFVPNAEVNARLQILGRVMEVRRRF